MLIYGFHSTHNFCSGHLVVLVSPLFSSLVPRNQGPDRGATYFSRTWWSKAISVKRLRSMIFGTWGVLVVMVAVVGLLRPYLQYMYIIYLYICVCVSVLYVCVCVCVCTCVHVCINTYYNIIYKWFVCWILGVKSTLIPAKPRIRQLMLASSKSRCSFN